MNRYRINQILEVLLFPFSDPSFAKNDYLLKKCQAYKAFLDANLDTKSGYEKREKRSADYRRANQELVKYLVEKNKWRVKSYDDIQKLCDLYYPVLKIEQPVNEENISLFYLKNLVRIADSLLTYRDGVAAIRTWNNRNSQLGDDIFYSQHVFDKVEIWNLLIRFMVPDILIVIFAVESELDESALYEQKPHISLADKLLVKCMKKGLAENHLHFNAGFDYERVWINRMHLANWKEKKQKHLPDGEINTFISAVFRFLAAGFFQNTDAESPLFLSWIKTLKEPFFEQIIWSLYSGDAMEVAGMGLPESFWSFWRPGRLEEIFREEDYLLLALYDNWLELKTSSEFILLYQCYKYIKYNYWDTAFGKIFIQYLRIKNNYFQLTQQRYMVPGLRHFQEYFNRAKVGEQQVVGWSGLALDVFRTQAKVTGLKKLEVRIAPADTRAVWDCFDLKGCREVAKPQLYKQLYDILYLYRRYMLESIIGVQKTRQLLSAEEKKRRDTSFSYVTLQQEVCREYKNIVNEISIPTLGLVYHFIKKESLDNVSGYFCWRKLEDKKIPFSQHRLFLRQYMANIAIILEEIRGEIPIVSDYIVGIDAASDENAMEPWMFVPTYQLMRSRKKARPILAKKHSHGYHYHNIQNVGFTYHVGEDFRHILSGLRHIDEVLSEFFYKPGDRLGHALALGLDIDRWGMDNEVIPIPRQEYMENLLWMWGKNIFNGVSLPMQMKNLEEEIIKQAEEIYNHHIPGITVRMLYQAYKKKFVYDHKKIVEELLEEEKEGEEKCTYCGKVGCIAEKRKNQVYCCYVAEKCGNYQESWTVNKLFCTNYCPVFEEKYSEVILVPVLKGEIDSYKLLQEHLLSEVERRGIYIEANPTSNVSIGEFDDIRDHPIFRMNALNQKDKDGHHALVTVNSDDPAVFNTNVENELAYIYYAIEHSGYAKEDILEWIDKIRQNGLESSFIQREKSVLVLLEEVGGILDELRKRGAE